MFLEVAKAEAYFHVVGKVGVATAKGEAGAVDWATVAIPAGVAGSEVEVGEAGRANVLIGEF